MKAHHRKHRDSNADLPCHHSPSHLPRRFPSSYFPRPHCRSLLLTFVAIFGIAYFSSSYSPSSYNFYDHHDSTTSRTTDDAATDLDTLISGSYIVVLKHGITLSTHFSALLSNHSSLFSSPSSSSSSPISTPSSASPATILPPSLAIEPLQIASYFTAYSASLPPALYDALLASPDVSSITPDRLIFPPPRGSGSPHGRVLLRDVDTREVITHRTYPPPLDSRANPASLSSSDNNITLFILSTGFSFPPSAAYDAHYGTNYVSGRRVRLGYNAILGGTDEDPIGMGTALAGIAASSTRGLVTGDQLQVRGVKVYDDSGVGSVSGLVSALVWVAGEIMDLKGGGGVVAMGVGEVPGDAEGVVKDALGAVSEAGGVVVRSGGGSGKVGVRVGVWEDGIGVTRGGVKVDVLAPGVAVGVNGEGRDVVVKGMEVAVVEVAAVVAGEMGRVGNYGRRSEGWRRWVRDLAGRRKGGANGMVWNGMGG